MRTVLSLTLLLFSLSLLSKDKLVYVELTTKERTVYQFNYYEGRQLMMCNEFIDTIISGAKVRTALKKTFYYYEDRKLTSTKTFNYYPSIKINQQGIFISNQIKEQNTNYEYK